MHPKTEDSVPESSQIRHALSTYLNAHVFRSRAYGAEVEHFRSRAWKAPSPNRLVILGSLYVDQVFERFKFVNKRIIRRRIKKLVGSCFETLYLSDLDFH